MHIKSKLTICFTHFADVYFFCPTILKNYVLHMTIAHFQKSGNLAGAHRICFQLHVPLNDPIIEHAPTLTPACHSFWKWAIETWQVGTSTVQLTHSYMFSFLFLYKRVKVQSSHPLLFTLSEGQGGGGFIEVRESTTPSYFGGKSVYFLSNPNPSYSTNYGSLFWCGSFKKFSVNAYRIYSNKHRIWDKNVNKRRLFKEFH